MKKPGRVSRFLLPLLLTTALAFALVACEVDTRVSITDTRNPPTFKLSGNGDLILFIVVGPYSSAEEIESGESDVKAIWKITPVGHAGKTVGGLPLITYGTVPLGFRQDTPSTGPVPPLEEGKFYSISTPSTGANFRVTCFKVEGGGVVKVQCRER